MNVIFDKIKVQVEKRLTFHFNQKSSQETNGDWRSLRHLEFRLENMF